MTILGNLSRVLNRMSGGPRGQTLSARIAEWWPECWFCLLMSRAVEPNHCAIELDRWRSQSEHAEARMAYGRPPGQQLPRHETSAEQAGTAHAQLVRELANWSLFEGGMPPEVLETSGGPPLATEVAAGVRHYVIADHRRRAPVLPQGPIHKDQCALEEFGPAEGREIYRS